MEERHKRMERAVKYLSHYMDTYDRQESYLNYSDETFMNDVLYGLGVALSEDYRFASGFERFKNVLRKHLGIGCGLDQPRSEQTKMACVRSVFLSPRSTIGEE